MYEIFTETYFSGAHRLREYEGKCESLHGHNWKVRAFIRAAELDRLGMVIDFKLLKTALGEVTEKLDHTDLNAVPPFDKINPSAENLSKFIFDELSALLNDNRAAVSKIMVWESHTSCATYTGE